jgi:kinesin family protein 2/24
MGALQYVAEAVEQACQSVCVEFFEIHGKQCLDLLDARKPLKLLADASDTVHVRGARQAHLQKPTAGSFAAIFHDALKLRSVEITERNPISSRSHAVCRIGFGQGGSLCLVDLAGSERNYEVTQMTAAQHRESADINKSLMALKDCFRMHALQRKDRFKRTEAPGKENGVPSRRVGVNARTSR